jgi:FdhD protein
MAQTQATDIIRYTGNGADATTDVLAVEEPLEIRVAFARGHKESKVVSVTMRTPGNDTELAAGFLYTEGLISQPQELLSAQQISGNVVLINVAASAEPRLMGLQRNFYTTSSCGVCGKASIDAIATTCSIPQHYPYDKLKVAASLICSLPELLSGVQSVFRQTGGIHACALFNEEGQLLCMREDVGRHNAMDKMVGRCLHDGLLPLVGKILLLSGRASFELVQKAVMAGITVIAAVGAPSSLAVQLAEEWNITLIGFLRGERFNIYSGAQRIVI